MTSNIQTQLNAKANASALAAYALKDGSNASGTWPISISGNAGTVGGYTAERVARTMFYLPRVRLVDAGWYRVFSLVGRTDASGANVLLHLTRFYNVTNNEAYTFSITIAYNGGISITQLSGRANARLIDKIRVTYDPNVTGSVFVDFHISTTVSGGNEYFVSGIGPGSFQSPVAVTETPAHSVEFSTVNGVGSNIGFVGPLEGNAATATKLATARTLWGRPFDGTGNVAGDMTGVGSITMTGDLSMSATSGVGLMIDSSLRNLSWAVNTSGGWARALRATDPTGETVLMNVAGIFGGGQTPNYVYMGGTSYTNAPFVVTAAGNVGIGTTSPNYKLSVVGTGNFTGRIFAQNGVTIGTTDDIGWYPGSGRIMAGVNAARGVNVGDLLVSNAWPDKTKVPTNGIYSKGAVLTDGYLQVGSGRLRWDAANNALYVEKSDGTACGLYSKGYMSARGSDPEAATWGSSELVPVVTLSKLTVGTSVSISVLDNAGLTADVREKMCDGTIGRVKAVFSDGSTEIWPVLHASERFISFGYDTVAGGYQDTMDIYEITIPSKTSVIRVEHFER